MDGERSIIRNCVIIAVLVVPCVVIAVVTALVCVVKVFLCAVEKLCAYVQRELDLFNEIYEDDLASVWDKGGLFVAFIKGEDVDGRRQTKNSLKPLSKKKKAASIKTSINNGIAVTSTVKSPTIGELLLRDLTLQRSCAPLRVYSRKTALPYDHKRQDCVKADVSLSRLNDRVTSEVVRGDNQLCAVKGSKDQSHETTKAPPCTNRGVSCQASSDSSEAAARAGSVDIVPCSRVGVIRQNSVAKQVNVSGGTERSSLRAEKRKKRKEAVSVGCLDQVGLDHSKTLTSQETERSSFVTNKGKQRSKPAKVYCSNQVGMDKKGATRESEDTSFGVNKGRKRRNAPRVGCSSELVSPGQSAKKRRNEPFEAHHRFKMPAPSSSRQLTQKKAYKAVPHSPAQVRQRKLMAVGLKPVSPLSGQLMKGNQEPAKENIPLLATNQEQAAVQEVLGEMVTAKRPLPVTPLKIQPAEESMDMYQEPLPATSFMTELVSLMEQLHISPCVDDPDFRVPDASDSESDDDCDGEYELFPELQSLGEQVLLLLQMLS